MRIRPLCLAAGAFVFAIFLFYFLKLPPFGEIEAERQAAACIEENGEVSIIGKTAESKASEQYSTVLLTEAVLVSDNHRYPVSSIKVTMNGQMRYGIGSVLLVRGIPEKVQGATNPGQFDSLLWNRVNGIGYVIKRPHLEILDKRTDAFPELLSRLHESMAGRIRDVFPEDVRGILASMLIGDRSMMEEGQQELWQMGGISHMLAISGLHLTLLGMGLFSLLRKMRTRIVPAAVLSAVFLFVYTVFTGCSVSTVRAFLMFLFVMGAKISGRTYDAWNSIALSAILILAENPWYLFSSGFQLSYAAVITCVIFRRSGKVLTALMLSLFTLPLILLSYYEIPLFGIGINLVTVPLLPAVLLCGIAGTVFGGFAALPAVILVRFDQFLLHLLGYLPFSTFMPGNPEPWMLLLYAVLLFLGIFFYRRHRHEKKRLFVFLCLPLLLGIFTLHFPEGLSLSFLDVGQGDGIVLSLAAGNHVLIDGGSSSVKEVGKNRIMPYLKYRGIRHLDYLFLTHMDGDHISGAEEILRMTEAHTTSLSVGTLVLPKLAVYGEKCRALTKLARAAGIRILYVSKGDAFFFGTTKLEILNPTGEASKEEEPEENEQCLVIAVHEGSFDALLTGDVSGEGEENLIKTFQENKNRYEVLKVAHHGSRFSTSAEFLSLIRPAAGIISAGKGNRYGHPHAELLQRLRAGGIKILRTDEAGEIEIRSDGQSFSVMPFLGGQVQQTVCRDA